MEIKEYLKLIKKYQTPNGAFSGRDISGKNFDSPLITAMILNCLNKFSDEASSCHSREGGNPDLIEIKKNAAKYLTSQKSDSWSFNIFARLDARAKNNPDDLLTSFIAINALANQDKKIINGEVLAKITFLLTSQETDEGGPYLSFIAPEEIELKPDLAVNAAIHRFLISQDIELPNLKNLLSMAMKTSDFSSHLLIHDLAVFYLIPDSKIKNKIIKNLALTLKKNKNLELESSFLLSNITPKYLDEKKHEKIIKILLDKINYYPIIKINNKNIISASPALFYALLAISENNYNNHQDKIQKITINKNIKFAERKIRQQVLKQAREKTRFLPKELAESAEKAIAKIIKHDKNGEIILLPYRFKQALLDEARQISPFLSVQLGLANLYVWAAYTVYDDFFDDEGRPKDLSAANLFLREFSIIYQNIIINLPEFKSYFTKIMDELDGANNWEVLHCRTKIENKILTIPNKLPDYKNLEKLAERSLAHAFGPMAILAIVKESKDDTEILNLYNFFKNYLIARQLNDDAHDWERDLRFGHLNPVVCLILEEATKQNIFKINIDEDIKMLRENIWMKLIEQVSKLILNKTKEAEKYLNKIKLIKNKKALIELLAPSIKSAQIALSEYAQSQEFTNAYNKQGKIILVGEKGEKIGEEEKLKTHKDGLLHCAFSIFIFNNKQEMLIQKRADGKYHCPGLWTNACCGHPRPDKDIKKEAQKRLNEEMGIKCELEEKFNFIYKEKLSNSLTEHEFDHVFFGTYNAEPKLNPEEAQNYRWININKLEEDIKKYPKKYTPWFKLILNKQDLEKYF